MPKVQQYNRQVQNQAAPNVQFNPNAPIEAFGGGRAAQEAGAVREVAQQQAAIFIEEQKKADEIAGDELGVEAKRFKQQLLHDPEKGALFQKGKNSFELPAKLQDEWKKFSEELTMKAPNERVKERISRIVGFEGLDLDEKLQVHVGRERQAYDQQVTKALTETAVNDAILNMDDPQKMSANIDIAIDAIRRSGQREGEDGSVTGPRVVQATSKVHATIIGRILDQGDDRKARAHFEKYKDQIGDAATLKEIEGALEEGSLRGESQRAADDIVMKYGENLGGALQAARGIEDPKLRDETVTRVKQTIADIRTAKSMRTEDLHKNASQIIDQTGSYDSIPASMLSQFSLAEKASLKAYAKARKENTLETNWGTYYDLKTMAANPKDRQKFVDLNLHTLYRSSMADAEFKELVNLQTSLKNGDGKATRELDGFLSTKDIVDGALKSADIDPSAKEGTKDAEKSYSFRLQVNNKLKALEAQTGKKPTSDEEVKIVNDLLVQVITDKGFIWDTKKPRFEVTAEDIPKADRQNYETYLKSRGVPVTDENLARLHRAYLKEK